MPLLKTLSDGEAARLFDYLALKLDFRRVEGVFTWDCDHTLAKTTQWLVNEEHTNPKAALAELRSLGGYCDCEVLLNCSLGHNAPDRII
jgi:Protein of unknown function (DUF2695)